MESNYKHGGGCKKAALSLGLNPAKVVDYSISVNMAATQFFPDDLIYLPSENIAYPDADYPELKEVINKAYKLNPSHYVITHGANEAIAVLFQGFNLNNKYKRREIRLIGSTYSEYNKYTDIYGFFFELVEFENMLESLSEAQDSIYIIVNPNTPSGVYHQLDDKIRELLEAGGVVVLDESFIDFTDKKSLIDLTLEYPELYIIKSMTKFYGSAGARLGLLISSNQFLNNILAILLPPWTISAYDNWYYTLMIPKYKQIQQATLEWIKTEKKKLSAIVDKASNLKFVNSSITNYHTIELSESFMKKENIKDIKEYFLKKHSIFIRPVDDFFGYKKNQFRVGFNLADDNVPLFDALKAIG